jgi:hypothetical protein
MKRDFSHLAVTRGQHAEIRAVLKAESLVASWDAPMRRARAEAEAAARNAGPSSHASGSTSWDEAFEKARRQ